jgi:hypothetical protein
MQVTAAGQIKITVAVFFLFSPDLYLMQAADLTLAPYWQKPGIPLMLTKQKVCRIF